MVRSLAAVLLVLALAACHGNTPPVPNPGPGNGLVCAPGMTPDGKGACKPL